jgi:adenylate cyclase
MRLRFRTVLVTVTLALLLMTVGVIGVTSFLSARSMAEDLSVQILTQTAQRIEEQVRSELDIAIGQSTLDAALLGSGQIDPANKEAVAAYFLAAIRARPQLSYLSWGVDKTGDLVNIERDRDGTLEVTTLTRQPDNRLELRSYRLRRDGTREEVATIPDKPQNDPRPRPYYVAARDAKAPTWTETYVFLGKGGRLTVPGVTRATPIYQDGALLGVLTADFDLFALSEFLGRLQVGAHGMAFLVELRRDGTRRVIAHPEPRRLAGPDGQALPTEQIADPRVQGFLATASFEAPEAPIAYDAGGTRYVGSMRRIDGDRGLRWVVATVLPEDDILGPVKESRRTTIAITLVSTVIAIVLAILLSMQIARALRRLAGETEAIARFHLDPKPVLPSSVVEVSQLASAVEDMKRGLRSFRKFVPADLVRNLVSSGDEAGLGGKRATITVHFSDVADFTTISEKLEPEKLVELLGEYLGVMSDNVLASGGTIDKYIGDAIMAFWNAPRAIDDHAFAACKAVLQNQAALARWRTVWAAAGKPELHARIGLHTGDAVVGNIGTEARLDYTAIGDTVNLASRLEGLNKGYGTEVLISEATYKLVEDRVVVRPIDRVAVKGKATGILIYELLGLTGEVDDVTIARAKRHAAALDAYFACKWEDAIAQFSEAPADDKAAALMIARARAFQNAPPPDGWDGVHRMTTK